MDDKHSNLIFYKFNRKTGGITKQIFKMMINYEQDTTITEDVKEED